MKNESFPSHTLLLYLLTVLSSPVLIIVRLSHKSPEASNGPSSTTGSTSSHHITPRPTATPLASGQIQNSNQKSSYTHSKPSTNSPHFIFPISFTSSPLPPFFLFHPPQFPQGNRAFSPSAPQLWNSLQPDIGNVDPLLAFKHDSERICLGLVLVSLDILS